MSRSNDKRRLFTTHQKRQIAIAADWKCENCGSLLVGQWHAHHVKRWADSGKTQIQNGMALCVGCHIREHSKMFVPYEWQKECKIREEECRRSGKSTVFIEASPGCGKSAMAAMIVKDWLQTGIVDHVLIIAPWKPIVQGLIEECERMELDCEKSLFSSSIEYQPPPTHEVTIMTTASACKPRIANAISQWSINDGMRFGLVVDEIHHNADCKPWGDGGLVLGLNASNILVMSGTPFRPDGIPITFLERHNNSYAADYSIRYPRAIKEGYVRHCTIRWIEGHIDLYDNNLGKSVSVPYQDLTKKQFNDMRLKIFDASNAFVQSTIEAVHSDLMRIRRQDEYKAAAALFVCMPGWNDKSDDKIVHQIARKVHQLTGILPVTVTHDDEDADGKIRSFKKSDHPYIVAVNKLSEGVNIPRILSVAMMRNIESEMLVRQIVGRALRRMGTWDNIPAQIYAPNISPMAEILRSIYDEASAGITERIVCSNCGSVPCTCLRICTYCGSVPCICDKCGSCGQKLFRCRCNASKRYEFIDDDSRTANGYFLNDDVELPFVRIAERLATADARFSGSNVVYVGAILKAAGMPVVDFDTSESAEQKLSRSADKLRRLVARLADLRYGGHRKLCATTELTNKFGLDIDDIGEHVSFQEVIAACMHVRSQIEVELMAKARAQDGNG